MSDGGGCGGVGGWQRYSGCITSIQNDVHGPLFVSKTYKQRKAAGFQANGHTWNLDFRRNSEAKSQSVQDRSGAHFFFLPLRPLGFFFFPFRRVINGAETNECNATPAVPRRQGSRYTPQSRSRKSHQIRRKAAWKSSCHVHT